jgi:hypothetical protein
MCENTNFGPVIFGLSARVLTLYRIGGVCRSDRGVRQRPGLVDDAVGTVGGDIRVYLMGK